MMKNLLIYIFLLSRCRQLEKWPFIHCPSLKGGIKKISYSICMAFSIAFRRNIILMILQVKKINLLSSAIILWKSTFTLNIPWESHECYLYVLPSKFIFPNSFFEYLVPYIVTIFCNGKLNWLPALEWIEKSIGVESIIRNLYFTLNFYLATSCAS